MNRFSELDDMDVSVGHGQTAREEMEPGLFGGGQIAHRAIRNYADATKCLENIHMNRADERAKTGLGTNIFDNDDPWSRQSDDIIPPIDSIVISAVGCWWCGPADLYGRRITQHRGEPW